MSDADDVGIAAKVEEEMRRKDDSFLRKIAVSVASATIIQVFISIYFAGTLSNQVSNNTKAIEALAKRSESQESMAVTLERVKTLVEGLVISAAKSEDRLSAVAAEQQSRTAIIKRTEEYLNTHRN